MPSVNWIRPLPQGLFVEPGGFFIDPTQPVKRAVITHGHSDHARAGHTRTLAHPATLAIMGVRYGAEMQPGTQPLDYDAPLQIGDVRLRLLPAGHILGSAQVVLEHAGTRIIVSGDYKRRADPTCAGFRVEPCDVFVTEATFGLPVFRHPPAIDEIRRLLHSVRLFPERAHLVGVYALGKCQRVIALLRQAGYDAPVFLHGALISLCMLYREHGVDLGELRQVSHASPDDLRGAIVLAPPSAIGDRWSRRLPDPVTALASGWMRVKQRAKQRGVEMPLVISDHADWDELTQTMKDMQAGEIWVTHGREEALIHYAGTQGLKARALALLGFDEEGQ